MEKSLAGKVALVAGASRGAGRGIALQLGAGGATVYVTGPQLARIYGFTDLDGSQPDAWRYVTEVQDAGKPADVTGYR